MEHSQFSYSIRLADLGDVAALPGIERAAARLFVDVGYPNLADRQVTGLSVLIAAQREERLWVALAGAAERPSARRPWASGDDPEESPVGFAFTSLVDGQPHLQEMDVHPEHGQRGLGRSLVNRVLDQAREQGYSRVTLTTFRAIPWNAPFYRKLGFRELAAGRMGPDLEALVEEESNQGLPTEDRVVLIHDLDH